MFRYQVSYLFVLELSEFNKEKKKKSIGKMEKLFFVIMLAKSGILKIYLEYSLASTCIVL